MKALTLWQPWATAMVEGKKLVETRSWAPPKTMAPLTIAIHAGKRVDDEASMFVEGKNYPTGVILGVVDVVKVATMNDQMIAAQTEEERSWGDWRSGRIAWFTKALLWFKEPIACTGHQQLWQIPSDVDAEVAKRLIEAGL